MMSVRRQWGWVVPAMFITAGFAGCADPQNGPSRKNGRDPTPAEVARMIEPNVLGISCLYDPFNPWMWNSEHTQIRGLKVGALYLLGPNSTGVFGDGIIRPKMFIAERDAQGKLDYRVIKEWSFDVAKAMPYRAKKRSRWGWGYGLFLNWGDMDLRGKEIRLTITFERTDGHVISGTTKGFRVPVQPDKS